MPEEVTNWEVKRALEGIDKRLERMEENMVSRATFEALAHRTNVMETELRAFISEALPTRMRTIEDDFDDLRKFNREQRSKWLFSIVAAGLSIVTSVVLILIKTGGVG